MKDGSRLSVGTQVYYVPTHCKKRTRDVNAEPGFVVEVGQVGAFCHFWRKPELKERRTQGNAEWVSFHLLVAKDSVPAERVERELRKLGLR